jgi:hypothetical protein
MLFMTNYDYSESISNFYKDYNIATCLHLKVSCILKLKKLVSNQSIVMSH